MRSDYCDGIDRRGFLRMGSVAGLSLAQLLQLQQTLAMQRPVPEIGIFYSSDLGNKKYLKWLI